MTSTYEYLPLAPTSNETRVLTLWPGTTSNNIEVTLHHIDLRGDVPLMYEALSYVWGSPDDRGLIVIKGTTFASDLEVQEKDQLRRNQHGYLLVTRNLEVALRHIRDLTKPCTLWIDAICIDQTSWEEKSRQIPIMGNIFRLAVRVIIWLGPEADDSNIAMEVLAEFGPNVYVNWSTKTYETTSPEPDGVLEAKLYKHGRFSIALSRLFARPWFERLWVVQEVRLANTETLVKCGSLTIPWEIFLRGIMQAGRLFADKPKDQQKMLAIATLYTSPVTQQPLGDLELTNKLKCTDPRDKIYAIMGLVFEDLGVRVDYRLPVTRVYEEIFTSYLNYYKRPDLLTWCEMDNGSPTTTPTWLPDWSKPRTTSLIKDCTLFYGFEADVLHNPPSILRVSGISCTLVTKCATTFSPGASDLEIKHFLFRAWGLLEERIEDLKKTTYSSGCSLLEALCCSVACFSFTEYDPARIDVPSLKSATEELLFILRSPVDEVPKKRLVSHASLYTILVTKPNQSIGYQLQCPSMPLR